MSDPQRYNVRNHSISDKRPSPKILIVEDNIPYAFQLSRCFRQPSDFGAFEVAVAPDVAEALSYLDRDEIDIYVVDLGLPKETGEVDLIENGVELVKRINQKSNAGILVHAESRLADQGKEMLLLGADDYLDKGADPEIVQAQASALWRRIRMLRQSTNRHMVHVGRVFRIRGWRLVVGEREITSDVGDIVRLSPTEHAFLSYLCTVEDHQIDRREFNVAVLGRPVYLQDQRIDNLVYRINDKLGSCVQNVSKKDGAYKLMEIRELRSR